MEIAGQRLFLPANYSFLRRLPARFEILVTGKGAEKSGLTAFELEISGQKLVLKSGVALRVGGRYELEKISETQFKLIRLVDEPSQPIDKPVIEHKQTHPGTRLDDVTYPVYLRQLPQELLAIKLMEEEGGTPRREGNKFRFDWEQHFSLSGVFVPVIGGGFSLFLSGSAAAGNLAQKLSGLLADIGIRNIRVVSRQVLESIAAGSIDIKR